MTLAAGSANPSCVLKMETVHSLTQGRACVDIVFVGLKLVVVLPGARRMRYHHSQVHFVASALSAEK